MQKHYFTKITCFVVLTLIAPLSFAKNHDGGDMNGGPRGGMQHHGMEQHDPIRKMLHELDLTEAQKSQVKEIMQSHKAQLKILKGQMQQGHMQLLQLVGHYDQDAVAKIAEQQASTLKQMIIQKAAIGHEVRNVLTDEQKQSLDKKIAKHQKIMAIMEEDE